MDICKFCRKQLEVNKLILHEFQCEKNCIKCDSCGLLYDKNDKESHDEEFHKQQQFCQFCNNFYQDISAHVCKESLILCNYCQMEVILKLYPEHEVYCGSRTEICNYCKQYIKKRDLILHQKSCPEENIHKASQQQEYKQNNIVVKELQKNEMNYPYSNQVPNIIQNQDFIQQIPDPKFFKEAQQNLGVKPTQNQIEFQYNLDQKYYQGNLYHNANNLNSNPNLEQREVQIFNQNTKQKPIFPYNAQGPIASQNQSQDYSQYDSNHHFNFPQNQFFQQQMQQNQINQQQFQNPNIFQQKQETQVKTIQNPQNQYGPNFQQNFTQNQQLNKNLIEGNPKQDVANEQFQYGLSPYFTNQSYPNQHKPMEVEFPQQVKQDLQKEAVVDRQIQNNQTENVNNYNDSIIGRILQEQIQADILQMSYQEYKEQKALQQKLESKKLEFQKQGHPNTVKQQVTTNIETEFEDMSDDQRLLQIMMLQMYEKQRNQRR